MIRAFLIGLCLLALPAYATPPLIGDLSNYRIDIDSGFNGTRLFLFGARNDIGDIVVVIRGPQKNFVVRKKENVGGIWINRERMRFFGVPDFYATASSKPLEDIGYPGLMSQLGIGERNLLEAPPDPRGQETYPDFSKAFLRYQHGRSLYMTAPEPVTFMGETLFKSVVVFPDNIPPGNYTAEIYLISGGEVVGMQSTPISVVKSGLDALVFNAAHHNPASYGLFAVIMALSIGWLAGRLFQKI